MPAPTHASTPALSTQALCTLAGVSRGVLRLYEREGLIAPPRRTAAGYRLYDSAVAARLQAVRLLKEIGFTLKEIALLLGEHDGGHLPHDRLQALAADQLAQVDARLARLRLVREALAAVVAGDFAAIDDPECHWLLDFLAAAPLPRPSSSSPSTTGAAA